MKFAKISQKLALWAGSPKTFMGALILIGLWGMSGPIFGYNDTWQLIINTSTTIITFLMVFLIQNTQNRDTEAMQLKLDELIRATQGAHNALMDLEELEERELDAFRSRYAALARAARDRTEDDEGVSGTPPVG